MRISDAPATYNNLYLSIDGKVATVVLRRPETRNAVSLELLKEMISVFDWLKARPDIHFLVVDHDGPVFSSGADLKEAARTHADPSGAPFNVRLKQQLAQEALTKLAHANQITFAAIRGSAYGAGVGIALSCDFKIMAENSTLSLPESKLGMFLSYGILPRLLAQIGPNKTREMTMMAESWSAQRCLEIGLVNNVVPPEQVLRSIQEQIHVLAERDWDALRINKKMINAYIIGQAPGSGFLMIESELAALSFTESTRWNL